MGSALAGLLAHDNDVYVVARGAHVAAIREHGLLLSGVIRRCVRLPAFETIDDVPLADLLIITTKAYDTAAAISSCREWAGPETMVLTLQNGLGNLEKLRAWKGKKAFGGTTSMGSTMLGPGKVRIAGLGETAVGSDLDIAGAMRIKRVFESSSIPVKVCRDIEARLWSKAVVSACINPLTAILRVPNGRLLESAALKRLIEDICGECVEVAESRGVQLSVRSTFSRVLAVAEGTSSNRSSMLQDIEKGRRTEIREINGAFCSFASSASIEVPLNRTLVAIVESLEQRGHEKG